MPTWRDRIEPIAPPLQWTKQRDGSWTAIGRFKALRMLDDRWALEDATRLERLVGIYATLPVAQGVAAFMVSNERPR